ncbi:MAG: very short patch repair endonuclease, partial [Candidatus Saelkia tenebricola]|nr:very short patch repair endonuclease [Candidatus Saelkia tenebricola]
MMDVYGKKTRSKVMSRVRSKRNESTELRLIAIFKKKKIKGWRRNCKIYGKPDFVFPKKRTIVFVDGCFWHGHNCRNTIPKSNIKYWKSKIKRNIARDKTVNRFLRGEGWSVFRLRECYIKKGELPKRLMSQLRER